MFIMNESKRVTLTLIKLNRLDNRKLYVIEKLRILENQFYVEMIQASRLNGTFYVSLSKLL